MSESVSLVRWIPCSCLFLSIYTGMSKMRLRLKKIDGVMFKLVREFFSFPASQEIPNDPILNFILLLKMTIFAVSGAITFTFGQILMGKV